MNTSSDTPFQPQRREPAECGMPRRDLLRLAATAVALGVVAPAQALGSSLRLSGAAPGWQDPGQEAATKTATITYPSMTVPTWSQTHTVPNPATGTWKTPTIMTITGRTRGPTSNPTGTTMITVTFPLTIIITQSGTRQTISYPTASFPSGTATITIITSPSSSETAGGEEWSLAAGGGRNELPDADGWHRMLRGNPQIA